MTLLEDLMVRVHRGGSLETGRLATELNTSVEMIEAMLEHLQRQGLISEYIRCTDGCEGCGLQTGCSIEPNLRLWQTGGKG